MHMHLYIYIHIYIYVLADIYIYTHLHICLHEYMNTRVSIYIYICEYTTTSIVPSNYQYHVNLRKMFQVYGTIAVYSTWDPNLGKFLTPLQSAYRFGGSWHRSHVRGAEVARIPDQPSSRTKDSMKNSSAYTP